MSDHRVNDRIRAREVRLIDPDGKQLGVKALPEALSVARQLDLDLVEVAPDANPPVCRIMDYNRFKYETAQRAKESRKKATNTSIKEMKYRPKIGTGDFVTKTRQVGKFLEEGHKVKITIMFRGREVSHPELGMKLLEHLADQVAAVSKIEAAPKLDGRNMIMVLAPDRRAKQAARKGAGADDAASTPAAPSGAEVATLAAGAPSRSSVGSNGPLPVAGATRPPVAPRPRPATSAPAASAQRVASASVATPSSSAPAPGGSGPAAPVHGVPVARSAMPAATGEGVLGTSS